MEQGPGLSWQPSLLDTGDDLGFDETFADLKRIQLDPTSWVDLAPEWVAGSDKLFAQLVSETDWGQRSRRMYDKTVEEPRLTSLWRESSGRPLDPPILEHMRVALSDRYEIAFDSVGLNLYRDGRDSVAWHRDRIGKEIPQPIVVLVSLGARRKFLLRPEGGGTSTTFNLGRGDLLVTGGDTQRRWEHGVPKVARAEPRISIAFRHGLEATAYRSKS